MFVVLSVGIVNGEHIIGIYILDIRGTFESRFLVGTSELLDVLFQAIRKWQNTKHTKLVKSYDQNLIEATLSHLFYLVK